MVAELLPANGQVAIKKIIYKQLALLSTIAGDVGRFIPTSLESSGMDISWLRLTGVAH